MASPEYEPSIIFSDFDGTAVIHHAMYNPRNWFKYPVLQMPGFSSFLQGVVTVGNFGGFISRRPAFRRAVTNRTITKHRLAGITPNASKVWHAGDETEKARLLALFAAEHGAVGMIEDKPQKLGSKLLDFMIQSPEEHSGSIHIAVIPSQQSISRTNALILEATERGLDVESESGSNATKIHFERGNAISLCQTDLSIASGIGFAQSVRAIRDARRAA